jgi:dUTP pyrophosphatase
MKIKIKYLTSGIIKIKPIAVGNWIDLRCAENMNLKAGEYKLIPLGVAMKLPENFEALIVPRSSTFKYYGLLMTNSPGIIDNSYSGNNDQWYFSAYATRDIELVKNDRICQFRIQEIQPELEFEQVENLDDPDRGGFGTTGIK